MDEILYTTMLCTTFWNVNKSQNITTKLFYLLIKNKPTQNPVPWVRVGEVFFLQMIHYTGWIFNVASEKET